MDEELEDELTVIKKALEALAAGGARLVGVTLAEGMPTPERPKPRWINVQSVNITYPPAALDGIKAGLEARRQEIAGT